MKLSVLFLVLSLLISSTASADVSQATHELNGSEIYSPTNESEISVYVIPPKFKYIIIGIIEAHGMAGATDLGAAISNRLDTLAEILLDPLSASTSNNSISEQPDIDLAIAALKKEAAKIGANAVVITNQKQVRVNQNATERQIVAAAIRIVENTESTLPQVESPPVTPITTSPNALLSKDGSYSVTIPSGWMQKDTSSQKYDISIRNADDSAEMIINAIPTKDIASWESYGKSLIKNLTSKMEKSSVSKIEKYKLNNFDSRKVEVSGVINGVKAHFVGTLIKTENKLIWLLGLSGDSTFANHIDEFNDIEKSFQLKL